VICRFAKSMVSQKVTGAIPISSPQKQNAGPQHDFGNPAVLKSYVKTGRSCATVLHRKPNDTASLR
jgi:hypothetical protein